MENEPKEPYLEKTSLENNEIPPDTLFKDQNQENSPKNEENDINQEKEDEKEDINQEKEITKENKEDIENNEEPNDEEINEIADKVQEEVLNYQKQENEEISHEVDEEKEVEDIKENNENVEEVEADQNEEIEENNEEENPENYEVEDSQQNHAEEEEEKQEYKERQGIHIHKEDEEKNENKEENIEEDTGKIHPVEQVESTANQNEDEKNIEYNALKEAVEEEENHEQVESKEQEDENHEQVESREQEEENHEQVESNEQEEEKEVENEEDENNIPEKHDEPIDRKEKIYNNQEAKKLIKKNENINKGVIEEIPRIMVFKRPKEQQTKHIVEEKEIQTKFKLSRKDYKNLVEIPKNEINSLDKKEIIILTGGIETGEYKFLGTETELKQEEPVAKADISKEEILSEISRRSKKEKKISYEVIDKYYSLTVFDEKGEIAKKSQKEKLEDDDSIPKDNFSKYLLEQINKIRADPQSFIGVIEDAKDNIKKSKNGNFYYNGNKIKVALVEGESAFNEAIEFLKSCKPMEPLIFSKNLIPPIPQNKEELQSKSFLRKSIDKMMCDGIRVNSYWRDIINDAEICFLLMIVDDNGDKKGMRRNDILSPNMKEIGISSVEINGRAVNYFVLSS
jgi:hypothetical protein